MFPDCTRPLFIISVHHPQIQLPSNILGEHQHLYLSRKNGFCFLHPLVTVLNTIIISKMILLVLIDPHQDHKPSHYHPHGQHGLPPGWGGNTKAPQLPQLKISAPEHLGSATITMPAWLITKLTKRVWSQSLFFILLFELVIVESGKKFQFKGS